MGTLLATVPLAAIAAVALLLLRGTPRRRQIGLVLFTVVWTGIVFAAGHELGRIPPEYRANIAIQKLVRDTDRFLAAGQVERVRDAYREAQQSLTQAGGTTDDAVRLIGDRLQPPSP